MSILDKLEIDNIHTMNMWSILQQAIDKNLINESNMASFLKELDEKKPLEDFTAPSHELFMKMIIDPRYYFGFNNYGNLWLDYNETISNMYFDFIIKRVINLYERTKKDMPYVVQFDSRFESHPSTEYIEQFLKKFKAIGSRCRLCLEEKNEIFPHGNTLYTSCDTYSQFFNM